MGFNIIGQGPLQKAAPPDGTPYPKGYRQLSPFLPMTMQEARDRGWDELDIVFISGDAYVDHSSFAMAVLDG